MAVGRYEGVGFTIELVRHGCSSTSTAARVVQDRDSDAERVAPGVASYFDLQ
jgi:hypothetical protein